MNRLSVLLLTTLILLSASRLHGQPPSLSHDSYGAPVVCNDGTITFSVAQASRDSKDLLTGSDLWAVEGWFNVDPGKCTAIGEGVVYHAGGLVGTDAVMLLAFAFRDSKGVWKGIKVEGGRSGWFYAMSPSNQQLCVTPEGFRYTRNSPKQIDLARQCDRSAAGYLLIPASFMYNGSPRNPTIFDGPQDEHDYLHVKIGSDDRAITSGSGAGAVQGSSEASPSLCGKVSCWDLFLQGLNKAANDNEARRVATNTDNNPPRPADAPRPVVSPARTPAALPPRPRLDPILVGKVDVSHLAGLQRGDTFEYVSSIFGQPRSGPEQDSSGFAGYPYKRDDGSSIRVNYNDHVVTRVKVYSKGTRSVPDPLLDLLGKNESAAVALLGPPKTRESLLTIDYTDLVWSFPMPGRPAESRPDPEAIQPLTLHFRTGVGCESVALVW
jgi:hypothetical protein